MAFCVISVLAPGSRWQYSIPRGRHDVSVSVDSTLSQTQGSVVTVSRNRKSKNQEDILGPKQVALKAGVPYNRGMIGFEDRFAAR